MALDIANTILNASPYFDDFNEYKNFHKILFRPSVAVQARELNQVQSILQNQIERFGQHVFKDGSIVKGCSLSFRGLERIDYVSINDQFVDNTSLSSTNTQFVNAIVVGNTTGVVAQIVAAREGFKASSTPARFFIRYTQPGFNGERIFKATSNDGGPEYLNIYQPGKTYIDKVILQVNTVTTVNTSNFPIGAKLTNTVSGARGFIVNAYANVSGNYVELRNVRKSFFNGDSLILSTDLNVTANVIAVDYESYANSFVDSVRVLTDNTELGYTSLGFGTGVAVSPGIIYHKGHFVKVDSHIAIINENSSDPSNKVLYFNTEEQVIKETDDSTLYDNASGTTNINAPGAHRLKLVSTIVAKDKTGANTISNTDIAFPILEFGNDGSVVAQRVETQYNILQKNLDQRTYEESGHYIVKPFTVSTKPHGSDNNQFIFEISQGLAYVKGARVEKTGNITVAARRGVDTESLREKPISMSYGNFVYVDEVRGYFPIDQSVEVVFYNSAQDAVSNGKVPGNAVTGTIVGYANIRAMRYAETTTASKGSPSYQYKLYLFNYRPVGSYTFQDARSVVYHAAAANSTNSLAFADLVLTGSVPRLEESSQTPLLFSLNAKAVKNLKTADNIYDTNYYYTGANTTATLTTTGVIAFSIGSAKGSIGISNDITGYIAASDEPLIDIIANTNCNTSVLTGTVAASATNVITGTGTTFDQDFIPGECICFEGLPSANTHRVVSIASATSMTINTAVTVVANTYKRVHLAGSIIALNPAAGTRRNVSIGVTGETATVDLGASYAADTPVKVRFYADNNEAEFLNKAINRNSVIIINTSNNVANSSGPWCLGVPDVLRLTGVFIGTNSSNFVLSTNRVADFVLDNGQRDTHYDLASISLSPSSTLGSLANTFLLVQFDCFTVNSSVGEGFFCVESYPVNDGFSANTKTTIRTWEIPSFKTTVANNQVEFDLRDYIDFRPYKANTANITVLSTSATINPAVTSNSFNVVTTTYNPYPGSTLKTNFTYYLGRKDRLILTSDEIFKDEEGLPGPLPRLSPPNPDVLNVAEVTIPPYPSLTDMEKYAVSRTDYNVKIDVLSHKRFTMKDISVLEKRIERLEYYTTLNLLESIAMQTNIPDSNGDQRFQNGFFVDPFNSHVFGKTDDPDYRVSIDERNGLLRPAFHPEVIEMEFDTNDSSYSNVQITGNMVTLAYEHELFIDQPYASDIVNVSGVPIAWNGTIDVRPRVRNDVEFLTRPVAVSSTSKVAQSYDNMTGVTPGAAQYGWWRENVQNNEDYNVKRFENDARDATSVPIESGRYVTAEDGQKVQSGVVYLSKERVYGFKAVGLKPNEIHYLFINNNDNSEYAALGEISSTPAAGDESFVIRTTPWGSPLESDSRGEIIGKFIVPAFALKSGTHTLTIRDRRTLTRGLDDSYAQAYFTVDIATIDPPVVIQPDPPGPPDANTPPAKPLPPEANTSDPPPSGNTPVSNNDPRVDPLPEAFARFVYTGDTTVYAEANSTGFVANGIFTLTFTDDSFVKNGSITAYAWNFGAVNGVINCTSNTATGVGPHTVSFQTINSIQDVTVTLIITDSASKTKEHSQTIRLKKLPKVVELQQPTPSVVVPNVELVLLSTVVNDISNPILHQNWSPLEFNPVLYTALDPPYNFLSYNTASALGSNTVLKITAKPSIDYEGNVVWTVSPVSGPTLSTYSYANLTEVYVTSGGTGYSNTDTIRFSNGQVDAYGTLFTDSAGAITYVQLTSKGNFSDGTAVTQQTFTANSTVNQNFTLSTSSTNTSILVTVNGLVQNPGIDYSVTGGGLTLSFVTPLDYLVSPDVVTVAYNASGVTPGTGLKTANQIRVQIANTTNPANSTNANTSAGIGASLLLVLGGTSNSISSSPKVTNDTLTLYSNTTSNAESVVQVKADFFLANGYANSIGNTTQTFTLRNTSVAPTPEVPARPLPGTASGTAGSGGGKAPERTRYMKH